MPFFITVTAVIYVLGIIILLHEGLVKDDKAACAALILMAIFWPLVGVLVFVSIPIVCSGIPQHDETGREWAPWQR